MPGPSEAPETGGRVHLYTSAQLGKHALSQTAQAFARLDLRTPEPSGLGAALAACVTRGILKIGDPKLLFYHLAAKKKTAKSLKIEEVDIAKIRKEAWDILRAY